MEGTKGKAPMASPAFSGDGSSNGKLMFLVEGYNVSSSDIAQMAQKLQQLDEAMRLNSVQYHSTWLQTMLSQFNPPLNQAQINNVYTMGLGLGLGLEHPSPAGPTQRVIQVDPQEKGVLLVHSLLACAKAVHENNCHVIQILLNQIQELVKSQMGPMRKVAFYFTEALIRRASGLYPPNPPNPKEYYANFYEAGPYLKFAHFTANQAILEAFEGKSHVHIIDFSMNQGMQWPALIQALSRRRGGPPALHLTGIGPPSLSDSDQLYQVGHRLARIAEAVRVEFEFRGIVANSLTDLKTFLLKIKVRECVAVNSVFEMHKLLARSGAIDKVLNLVKRIKPAVVTIVEQEANHNELNFLNRFTESLHYYSTLFDSLEGSIIDNIEDKVQTEMYLEKEIVNVIACEGTFRVERHETLTQWRARFGLAGFTPVLFRYNVFKQASLLLAVFGGSEGFKVEAKNGGLMLSWHARPLIATSVWRLAQ